MRSQDEKLAANERELTCARGEVADLRENVRRMQMRHSAIMHEVRTQPPPAIATGEDNICCKEC